MSSYQEISSFIWKIGDSLLRGVYKPNEFGEVILPFVVLRRLDCLLEPHKDMIVKLQEDSRKTDIDITPIVKKKTGLSFFNSSKYDLSRLKSDPNGLKLNFQNYLNGFSDNVLQIIDNFHLDNQIEKLLKNNRLYSLIDKFSEFDFHPNKIDNHTMGLIFEELLRKYSEMSNETSGEFFTPRDVINLLVSLVFTGDVSNLDGEGIIRSIYDPCCGTGGMLTVGKQWVHNNISNNVRFNLYGQELNDKTFAICKSDFLISGDDPERIKLGSSLTNDQYQDDKFDYMIANPPYGGDWTSEKKIILEESKSGLGRFSVGTPRVSDGQLLFVQHLISKMKPKGSRIGIVLNGSPLFTGDSGSGESEIRKWIIENDLLECIIQLPDEMFVKTDITTYIWILDNTKEESRRGKVQLIDSSDIYKMMKKSQGKKRKYISEDNCEIILSMYKDYVENEYSKIFPNEFFGYTKVTIEQPLMENGEIVVDGKGKVKVDTSLRDHERVPLSQDIEEYFEKEVKPHLPNSWMDRSKDKVGYEINFTKYFYKYTPLRSTVDILNDLNQLEQESDGLFSQLVK